MAPEGSHREGVYMHMYVEWLMEICFDTSYYSKERSEASVGKSKVHTSCVCVCVHAVLLTLNKTFKHALGPNKWISNDCLTTRKLNTHLQLVMMGNNQFSSHIEQHLMHLFFLKHWNGAKRAKTGALSKIDEVLKMTVVTMRSHYVTLSPDPVLPLAQHRHRKRSTGCDCQP